MSGWVAVISLDRQSPADASELERLADAYEQVRGAGGRERATSTLACAVQIGAPGRPVPGVERAPGRWAMAAGYVPPIQPLTTTPPTELDGQWASICVDEEAQSTVLAVDAFGMFGLYLFERDRQIFASTSALALALHARAEPVREEVLSFLRLGYQIAPTTMWRGVRRMLPAEQLVVDRTGSSRRIGWRPVRDASVTRLDMQESARRLCDVGLAAGARYRPARHAWADLTGGFDSRTMTLLMERAGCEFETATNGEPGDADVRIARQVAERRGWRWRSIGPPPDWTAQAERLIPAALGWGDGHLEVLQLAEVFGAHEARREGSDASVVFTGGGIEHFRHYAWYSEFLRAGRTHDVDLKRWVAMLGMRPVAVGVFRADPTPMVAERLRQRLAQHIAPHADERNTFQADMVYAYKSTGHFGAYASAGARFFDVGIPGYARDLHTTAVSTKARHRNAHRLNRWVLEMLDPEIAALPTAIGGPATPMRLTNAWRYAPYYRSFARKAINKLAQTTDVRLLPPVPTNRGFALQRSAGREALRRHLLEDGAVRPGGFRSAALYEREGLEALLRGSHAPDFEHDPLLGRIATVELALRLVGTGV